MQKTAVIYGLAAATLVGAFLLVPKMVAKPPMPTPTLPPPVDDKTVTELIYGDGTVQITAKVDRAHVLDNGSEPLWLDLSIRADGVQSRAPLSAVLVVDRSGSMAGEKIEQARMAAERFVQRMQEGDQLAVVTFGSDVSVDLPLVTINADTRARAKAVVRRIEEGGGTNIDGGMRAAEQMLQQAALSGRVGRIVLVSDNRPTEGDRRTGTLVGHASRLREMRIATSTLGLGLDYNEDLMEAMASEGGGRYHYLRDGAQLARILDDELTQASAVIAAGVQVHLPRDLGGLSFLAAPGQKVQQRDSVMIDVGDLAAGEERRVLVQLAVGAGGADLRFAAPELVYRKPTASSESLVAHRADAFRLKRTSDVQQVDQSRRDDVRVRVLQVEASLALTESMKAYADGKSDTAVTMLRENKAKLETVAKRTNNRALYEEAQNLGGTIDFMDDAPAPAAPAAQDMIKSQKARAFQLRR
jgi:Ca-activated chloride channel family protein